ncbi:LCP family protein [Streptomyces sp. NPDC002952]|uniref:LCP family protein n=1 Tax=Streptomyces sp. NPDC002952 TaxID=3364673 RepID=UPI003679795C
MGTRARGKTARPRLRHTGEPGRRHSPYGDEGHRVRPGDESAARAESAQEAARGTAATGPVDGGHGRRPRGSRSARRRRGHRALRWSLTVLAVLILGTAGAGYLYYQHLNGNIRKDDLNLGDEKDRPAEAEANAAGQTPLNILLIGSDARDTRENQKLGAARDTFDGVPLADVQMLLHLSADRSNMSVVSVPRDTLVHIPKCTDPDDGKVYPATVLPTAVNQSLGRGGPGCTVATWEKLTGIHIDHFMKIDFAGVVSMADAIGGVPVCVDANILSRDRQGHGSGLKLAKGTHPVKGKQALQWLRTRYGFGDGSDLMRARAQHMYMNAMVRRLRENATLTNPGKLRSLAETATGALTVDDGLGTVKKLYDLATELRRVPTKGITMTTMPNRYAGARVKPTEDAFTLFRLVREDIALTGKGKHSKAAETRVSDDPAADEDEIVVRVRNGTRTDTLAPVGGRASEVTRVLTGKGFTKAKADTSGALAEATTAVRYPDAALEGDAQRVARSLGIPLRAVTRSPSVPGVTLIVGADWRSGTTYEAPKRDDGLPSSADALNAAEKGKCMPVNPDYTW